MRKAALLLAIVLLAGCTGGKSADPGAVPAGATDTTGLLRGLVVDDAIRPLGGANVTAVGNGGTFNTTTGADGTFRITGMPPGAYLVSASKAYHAAQQLSVDVRAGVDEPELVKLQLMFEASSVPYATVYKLEGFHECGVNWIRICANVNILTWIVLCADSNGAVCLGNVTNDRSLLMQTIDGVPSFLQAELTWEPTLDTGKEMTLLLGGANMTELSVGMAPAFNVTSGESPLMARVTNHEAADTWCATVPDPPCETPQTLNSSGIGAERALLVQVDAGPTVDHSTPMCDDAPGWCGSGFSAQQPFTMFTTVFYGYEPPLEWRFTDSPPPAPPA